MEKHLRFWCHILTLLYFSSLVTACSKKESCWTCKVTVRESGSQSPGSSSTVKEFCQKTEDEIKAIEKEGTFTSSATAGGVKYTIKTTTRCDKSNPKGVIPNDRGKR